MTNNNEPMLRSIDEIRGETFFVPAYQRGYRWTVRQVEELLNDVYQFTTDPNLRPDGFYCLQPVVVARHGNEWELVDGQQRLTTIHLILSYFNQRVVEEYRKPQFSLRYETRPESGEFLETREIARRKENIDFAHMTAAFEAIAAWFKADKRASRVNDIESAFLHKVKVIWYEVGGEAKPMEVFRRLNVGKIPLTNAELVKALFLRARNFTGEGERAMQLHQLRIAQEWDAMERRLQDDAFWYFFSNDEPGPNRIEFILKLRSADFGRDVALDGDKSALFLAFDHRLVDGRTARDEWDEVKRIFARLEEWFNDRYYHSVIGFLAAQKSQGKQASIRDVLRLAQDCKAKRAFRQSLKDRVFQKLLGQSREIVAQQEGGIEGFIQGFLDALDYDDDGAVIRNTLLLFNLASLLEPEKGTTRFPFDHFKGDKWDIEHIRSVQSRMPERVDDRKRWLDNVFAYLADGRTTGEVAGSGSGVASTVLARARLLRETEPFDNNAFPGVFEELLGVFDPNFSPEGDDGIGNLTLLDAGTNRSYRNAMFPVKRATVLLQDKAGKFVPICTRNAFLKYYSRKVNNMLTWSRDDATDHATAIRKTLAGFFGQTPGSAQ
jgi:hypothetical protein